MPSVPAKPPWFTRRRKALLGVLVVLFLLNTAYPVVWFSLPIHGRVVDTVTGKPVAGAVVSMNWPIKWPTGPEVFQIAVAEAVSDPDGHFRIPGWGPRFWLELGSVYYEAPDTRILHPDYLPVTFNNIVHGRTYRTARAWPWVRYSWQGQTIRLRPRPSDPVSWVRALDAFAQPLVALTSGGHGEICYAGHMGRTFELLHLQLSLHEHFAESSEIQFVGARTARAACPATILSLWVPRPCQCQPDFPCS